MIPLYLWSINPDNAEKIAMAKILWVLEKKQFMLPKNMSKLKKYIYSCVYEQKKMWILKNRNSKKTVGLAEKQKADLDSTGPL